MKIMASGPITSWQIDGETMETVITREVFSWKRVQTETNAFIVLICSQTKMVFDTGELASENQGPISVRTLNVAR